MDPAQGEFNHIKTNSICAISRPADRRHDHDMGIHDPGLLAKPKTSVISPVPIAMSAGSPKARMKSGVKNVAPSTPEAIAVGGLFIGMISTGLGELNGYFLLQRCRVPSRVAVASSVFVVAVTALVASTGHFVKFVQTGGETLNTVLSLVIFTIPGVIIGGQLGPLISSRISQHTLERALAVLFILVAALMLGEVILRP